jgi:hypothetical protein
MLILGQPPIIHWDKMKLNLKERYLPLDYDDSLRTTDTIEIRAMTVALSKKMCNHGFDSACSRIEQPDITN